MIPVHGRFGLSTSRATTNLWWQTQDRHIMRSICYWPEFIDACAEVTEFAKLRASWSLPRQLKAIWLGHPSYVWRRGQDRRLAFHLSSMSSCAPSAILDIGCGLGMYVSQFRQFSDDVYGVDIDPDKIARASEWLPKSAGLAGPKSCRSPMTASTSFCSTKSHRARRRRSSNDQLGRPIVCWRQAGTSSSTRPIGWYPFETHGFFFAGKYHGPCNLPILANWVPNFVRDYFAPHDTGSIPSTRYM